MANEKTQLTPEMLVPILGEALVRSDLITDVDLK